MTVVIPAWGEHATAHLPRAVASLRDQRPRPEILVIDNASDVEVPRPDGVTDVIRAPQRLSLGRARNLGLRAVRTPYVVVWDADDEMLPGTLERLVAALGADPGAVAATSGIVEDESGHPHGWPRPWTFRLPRTVFAAAQPVSSLFPTTGAVLMRTEPALGGGGFGEAESGDDWVLGVSLALRGRVLHDPRPGRIYRRREGSIWDRYGQRPFLQRHMADVRRRLREDPVTPPALRRVLPLVAAAQYAVLFGVRPASRAWRRTRS